MSESGGEELVVPTAAGGLTHLVHPGFGAALHFGRGDVFNVLRETPLVTEGIADFAIAVSPELILQRHFNLGAGLDGTLEERVDVIVIDEESTAGDGLG